MAITSIQLKSLTKSTTLNGVTLTAQRVEVWLVKAQFDDDAQTIENGALAAGLPVEGDILGTENYIVQRVSIAQVNNAQNAANDTRVFTYEVTWQPPPIPDWVADPLFRPAEIHWEGLAFKKTFFSDAAGVFYRNSAKQPYRNIPPRIVNGGAVTIVRNEADNPSTACVQDSHTVCSDTDFYGVTGSFCLMGLITSERLDDPVYGIYWRTSYPISYNSEGWNEKVIDEGPCYLDGSSNLVVSVDAKGIPTGPVNLDGSGHLLGSATPVYYPSTGFTQFKTSSFSGLGLPDPF